MNFKMWIKAIRVIPRITKEEWNELDIISRWLIATRFAVLIMTFLSAAFAGIFALRANQFNFWYWLLVVAGLIFAHATNNLANDYTDYKRGIDVDNYYRAQYGPQPLVHGLLTKKQMLTYIVVTGLIALFIGIVFLYLRGGLTLLLLTLGVFFVLFYTYPLKYIALGEIAVFIVWGPLMIGGGYYAITGNWDWQVVLASMPYALGVTSVIFGKHIDKYSIDKAKGIHTLPVVIGEKASRYAVLGMMLLQYILVGVLIVEKFFTPILLIVLLAVPTFFRILPFFKAPKPDEKPEDYPDIWPNYFVAAAFLHNRSFGVYFLVGIILDTVLKLLTS